MSLIQNGRKRFIECCKGVIVSDATQPTEEVSYIEIVFQPDSSIFDSIAFKKDHIQTYTSI